MAGSIGGDKNLLDELDGIIDAELKKEDIPHDIFDFAVRYMLLVYEDQARFFFNGVAEYPPYQAMMILDQQKYSLKHCLLKTLSTSQKSKVSIQSKVIPKLYKRALRFLDYGLLYDKLYRLLGSVYNGTAMLERANGSYFAHLTNPEAERYAILEMFGHGGDPEPDILGLLFYWLKNEEGDAQSIREWFCNVTKLKKRIITYRYDARLLEHICKKVPQRTLIIPEDFNFSWGSSQETQALINSLMVRCFFHVMSVNCYASKIGLEGAGVESVLLEIDEEDLVEDIKFLADFEYSKIRSFIDFLTYGNKTTNPDPALQPIFKFSSGKLVIPCLLVLTNNMQRNLMCLYARLNAKEFNKQSKLLEEHMIRDLSPSIEKFDFKEINKTIRVGQKSEEIDILLLDNKRSSLLVIELRAMLQPGDVREVSDRTKVCEEKVEQLDRKLKFIKDNVNEVLSNYFPRAEVDESRLSVNGAVVLKGYGGKPSKIDRVPITTAEILKVGLNYTSDLKVLHTWLSDKDWLPCKGKHFLNESETLNLTNCNVTRPIVHSLVEPDKYLDHVRETIKSVTVSQEKVPLGQ